jgi:hypothetical protein
MCHTPVRDLRGESYRAASVSKVLLSPYVIQDIFKVTQLNILINVQQSPSNTTDLM